MSVHCRDAPRFTVPRPKNPYAALGKAAEITARFPAFADQPFGDWCQVLIGQLNRDEHLFVQEGGKVVGFAGWMRTEHSEGEAWLRGERPAEWRATGDAVVLNAIQADTRGALAFLVGELAGRQPWARMIYAKRFYPDGRVRPLRLPREGLIRRALASA